MFHLIARLAAFIPSNFKRLPVAAPLQGVAQQLMERAEARAGRNPRQARELRRAAYAYLSVIR
ncbi:hypothetical protein [Polaromonas sp. YR568]|uniref:hypothetical protein n=1 Tax=Polaromonas sp. YR568 TaxID=1855301 RepID=UPI003137E4D4